MTFLQTLDYFQSSHSKIDLYFLHTDPSLKHIQGNNNPTLKSLELDTTRDIQTQLQQSNLDPKNILGLVYKNLVTENNQLQLFFLTQLNEDDLQTSSQNDWLTLDDIEDNYTGAEAQIAALYAFGYLNCLRDKDEVSWYPVE